MVTIFVCRETSFMKIYAVRNLHFTKGAIVFLFFKRNMSMKNLKSLSAIFSNILIQSAIELHLQKPNLLVDVPLPSKQFI